MTLLCRDCKHHRRRTFLQWLRGAHEWGNCAVSPFGAWFNRQHYDMPEYCGPRGRFWEWK